MIRPSHPNPIDRQFDARKLWDAVDGDSHCPPELPTSPIVAFAPPSLEELA